LKTAKDRWAKELPIDKFIASCFLHLVLSAIFIDEL